MEEHLQTTGQELINVAIDQTRKLYATKKQKFKSKIDLQNVPKTKLPKSNAGKIDFPMLNLNNKDSPSENQNTA